MTLAVTRLSLMHEMVRNRYIEHASKVKHTTTAASSNTYVQGFRRTI
jgi:hypothetical protein